MKRLSDAKTFVRKLKQPNAYKGTSSRRYFKKNDFNTACFEFT